MILAPYIVNLVRLLIFRAYNICSTYFSFHNELSYSKSFLKGNSFPMPLIDRVTRSFLDHTSAGTGKNIWLGMINLLYIFPSQGLVVYSLSLVSLDLLNNVILVINCELFSPPLIVYPICVISAIVNENLQLNRSISLFLQHFVVYSMLA